MNIYLKAYEDFKSEIYNVKFTNRTDSTVVVADNIEGNEIGLALPQEYRNKKNTNDTIILGPGESETHELVFTKFFDDGDDSKSILFSSIRVIENYKGEDGTEEEQRQEIDNAIAKFSVEVPVK